LCVFLNVHQRIPFSVNFGCQISGKSAATINYIKELIAGMYY